jgi:hypothetical protein
VIQVCSRCGTRWNVRDNQRVWCPRCNGPLLAPSAPPNAVGRPPGQISLDRQHRQRAAAKLPAGFRWIAVRPGPPPPSRTQPRPLGPTPRYGTIPRWGLIDQFTPGFGAAEQAPRKNASAIAVRAALLASSAVFTLAALAHILRYLLLLINRTRLLPPLVANATLLMGVLVSLAAMVAVIVTAAVMTSWLIGRRAEVFRFHGRADPRSEWELWVGCLTPVVNLVWAPVFLIELARAEHSQARLRAPITMWWIAWVSSTAISAWAIWTSSASEPQGIADNTVTVIIAYLAGLAVLLLLWRVFDGFVRKPIERPLHRWVMVPDDQRAQTPDSEVSADLIDGDNVESEPAVEPRDREPAA